jgi:hypothetical protein
VKFFQVPWRVVVEKESFQGPMARGSGEGNFSKSRGAWYWRAKFFKVPWRVVVEKEIFQSTLSLGSG